MNTWKTCIVGLLCLVVLGLVVIAARAHDAPGGWAYPFECCSGIDCRPVSSARVKATPQGYVLPTGETVPYRSPKIRPSPDGEFHWCSVAGSDEGKTICLFVPPQSF